MADCLLPCRESGCRTPVWMWLTSSPPMVSCTSSARYSQHRAGSGWAPSLTGPEAVPWLRGSPSACQVLLPPRGVVQTGPGLLQQLSSVPAFGLFRDLLQVLGSAWLGWGALSSGVQSRLAPSVMTKDQHAYPYPLSPAPPAGVPDRGCHCLHHLRAHKSLTRSPGQQQQPGEAVVDVRAREGEHIEVRDTGVWRAELPLACRMQTRCATT